MVLDLDRVNLPVGSLRDPCNTAAGRSRPAGAERESPRTSFCALHLVPSRRWRLAVDALEERIVSYPPCLRRRLGAV